MCNSSFQRNCHTYRISFFDHGIQRLSEAYKGFMVMLKLLHAFIAILAYRFHSAVEARLALLTSDIDDIKGSPVWLKLPKLTQVCAESRVSFTVSVRVIYLCSRQAVTCKIVIV